MLETQLFGGAFECSIPARFTDISQFRLVPDHQEVFADSNSDQSICFDILEYQETSDEKALLVHWNELASLNDCKEKEVCESGTLAPADMQLLEGADFTGYLIGNQRVSKGRDDISKANSVSMYMCLIRCKKVTSDIVISINVPVEIADGSQSSGAHILGNDENQALVRQVLSTFRIKDWGIFG
eukprot:208424_1